MGKQREPVLRGQFLSQAGRQQFRALALSVGMVVAGLFVSVVKGLHCGHELPVAVLQNRGWTATMNGPSTHCHTNRSIARGSTLRNLIQMSMRGN